MPQIDGTAIIMKTNETICLQIVTGRPPRACLKRGLHGAIKLQVEQHVFPNLLEKVRNWYGTATIYLIFTAYERLIPECYMSWGHP